jgi:hypothetical protein
MATKPSRRREPGRPQTSLREDPDRYQIAYYIARRMAFPVESETALARHIMQVHYGDIGSRDEAEAFASAILEGQTVRLDPKTRDRLRGRDNPQEYKDWRNRDWANARADNFARKCRAIEEKLTRNPALDAADPESDLYWSIRMVNAWYVVLKPWAHPDPLAVARHFAAQVGETEYFEREMGPRFLTFKLISERKD